MLARLGIIVAVAALLPACGESFRPVIRGLDPPNGASAVDQSAKPNMLLAVGASIELTGGDGRFVLFNVTGGAPLGPSMSAPT